MARWPIAEMRQALLNEPQPQASLFDSTEMDEWVELDGQSQVDIAVQASGWAQEKAEVDLLLNLARAAAKDAVRQNLSAPLQVSGHPQATVVVRFADEPAAAQ